MADNNNNEYEGDDIGDDNSNEYQQSDKTTTFHNLFNMIDPLQFSTFLFILLLLFVIYLLLPRGIRKQYFYAHPKRHAWMARNNNSMSNGSNSSSSRSLQQQQRNNVNNNNMASTPLGLQSSMETGSYAGGSSILGSGTAYTAGSASAVLLATGQQQQQLSPMMGLGGVDAANMGNTTPYNNNNNNNNTDNQEIVISAAMQQLRDPGVLIVAHGSRGKPKTVRLSLTETSITWRTETRKLLPTTSNNNKLQQQQQLLPKMGKLHSVPLAHIMYVDVGKQTTALRRVENAAVPDVLCFSLLTKEGSLDLEAASARERDALVSCFSLVLDEVHSAQNWRDIYRGPSSDMPSSFDEFDTNQK